MAMVDCETEATAEPDERAASDPGRRIIELDEFFMSLALAEARQARDADEVPVGAVVVLDQRMLGYGHNHPIGSHDPTAHAEIIALRQAARASGNYRLTGATLYVTIEPCAMCAGALVNARIQRLVYGAADVRAGAIASVFQIATNSSLNHQVEITAGLLEAECRELMQAFFQQRRKPKLDHFASPTV
jgi:tRNA(adenine34) deaminase